MGTRGWEPHETSPSLGRGPGVLLRLGIIWDFARIRCAAVHEESHSSRALAGIARERRC